MENYPKEYSKRYWKKLFNDAKKEVEQETNVKGMAKMLAWDIILTTILIYGFTLLFGVSISSQLLIGREVQNSTYLVISILISLFLATFLQVLYLKHFVIPIRSFFRKFDLAAKKDFEKTNKINDLERKNAEQDENHNNEMSELKSNLPRINMIDSGIDSVFENSREYTENSLLLRNINGRRLVAYIDFINDPKRKSGNNTARGVSVLLNCYYADSKFPVRDQWYGKWAEQLEKNSAGNKEIDILSNGKSGKKRMIIGYSDNNNVFNLLDYKSSEIPNSFGEIKIFDFLEEGIYFISANVSGENMPEEICLCFKLEINESGISCFEQINSDDIISKDELEIFDEN